MPRPSKLKVPYALPRAQGQRAVRDGDADVGADKGALDMCGHVVVALCSVPVERGPATTTTTATTTAVITIIMTIIRHDALQRVRHVGEHVRVPVLVERQRARRVLHKQVHQPDAQRRDELPELCGHLGRDEVAPARARRAERDGLLGPGCRGGGGCSGWGCHCGGGVVGEEEERGCQGRGWGWGWFL